MTDIALCALARTDPRAEVELMARHERLATGEATGFFMRGHSREDVAQEARLGLLYAIRQFDPGNGAPFFAFAKLCVRRQIVTAVIRSQRLKYQHLNDSLRHQEDEDGDLRPSAELVEAPDADPVDIVILREQLRALADAMAALSPLERHWIGVVMNGGQYSGQGEARNKPADNAVQRARAKLRAAA